MGPRGTPPLGSLNFGCQGGPIGPPLADLPGREFFYPPADGRFLCPFSKKMYFLPSSGPISCFLATFAPFFSAFPRTSGPKFQALSGGWRHFSGVKSLKNRVFSGSQAFFGPFFQAVCRLFSHDLSLFFCKSGGCSHFFCPKNRCFSLKNSVFPFKSRGELIFLAPKRLKSGSFQHFSRT